MGPGMKTKLKAFVAMIAVGSPAIAQVTIGANGQPVAPEKPIYLSCIGSQLQFGNGFGPNFTAEHKGVREVIVVDKVRGVISVDTSLAGHVDARMYENDDEWYAAVQQVNLPYKGKVIQYVAVQVNRINGQGQITYSVDPKQHTAYMDFGGTCYPAAPRF